MGDARGGLRLGLEAAVVAAVTILLVRASWSAWALVVAPGAEQVEQVERLVGLAVTASGAAAGAWLSAWYAACTTCVLLATVGRRWRRLERLVLERGPRLARRALAGALGVGLTLGVTAVGPAAADVGDPLDLGWSSSSTPSHGAGQGPEPPSSETAPDPRATAPTAEPTTPGPTPTGPTPAAPTTTGPAPAGPATTGPHGASATEPTTTPSSPPATSPAEPSTATASTAQSTGATAPAGSSDPSGATGLPGREARDQTGADRVSVQAGDSLWSIAARHRPDATASQTAADWPVWYRLNADVIGGDPHLIHPGQQLRIPAADDLPTT